MNKKNRRKILLFLSLMVLAGLFVDAQTTRAFFDIPYNMTTMQLNALSPVVHQPIIRFLVVLVLLVVESTTFMVISASLLDWASSSPVILDNILVNKGWHYNVGLVNISFILIFIAIAFFYIFKAENFGMKKALPQLIIIAILINFSLLFTGMIVDVGQIFQNSLKTTLFESGGLAAAAMGPLKNSGGALAGVVTAIPLSYMILSAIPVPFASVVGAVAIGGLVLSGEAMFGMISQTIILIIFNFLAGFIFLIYAIFFLVRIGVIWLLAIMAPLAFAAYILPQTQKYFKQWLQTLFQWTFLGVVMFFLMGLGIKIFNAIPIEGVMPDQTLPGGWKFGSVYVKYIFLFVYLVVVLAVAKKTVPAGMNAVWGAGEAMARTGAMSGAAGAGVAARALKTGVGTARNVYTASKLGGASTRWAMGQAMRRGWAVAKPTIGPSAAGRGILNAVKDMARAGFGPSVGLKTNPKRKKKCANPGGLAACPNYDRWIDARETLCPTCGSVSFRDERPV